MARIVRSFLHRSALALRRVGIVRVVATALLVPTCCAGLATMIGWSLRSTELERVRTNAADLSALADAGRQAVRGVLAASSGYLEPAEARSDVRQRWRRFQLSFNAFCTNLDPLAADREGLSSLCSSQSAFFERIAPKIMAFDPPTRLLDHDLMREMFAERDEISAVATRADAGVERLRRHDRADQIVMAATSAGFAGACLCILLLAGRSDRTSRRHQQDAEEAHRLVMDVIQAIPAGVVLFDRQQRLMTFNDAAVRSSPLLGRPGIIGTTYEALARDSEQLSGEHGAVPFGSPRDWLRHFRRSERKMRLPVGERWFEWSDRLTPGGHIVSLRIDITELKQRTLELEAARAEHEALLDALPDAVYTLDIRTGRFTYANPSAARLLGLTRRQVVGTALLDLVLDDDDRAAVEAAGHGGSPAPGLAPATAQFRIKSGEAIRRLEARFTTTVGVFGTAIVGIMRELESSSKVDTPSPE
jgi:PAS domain S-box-containing protein